MRAPAGTIVNKGCRPGRANSMVLDGGWATMPAAYVAVEASLMDGRDLAFGAVK